MGNKTIVKRINIELHKAIEKQRQILEETLEKKVTWSKASTYCARLIKNGSFVYISKRRKKGINISPIIKG